MNPLNLLFVLRARYKIVLVVMLVTFAALLVGSLLVPKRYLAETAVMVDTRSRGSMRLLFWHFSAGSVERDICCTGLEDTRCPRSCYLQA